MRVFAVELNAIRVMERGRGLPPQAAKCNVCNSGDDESYYHFLFQCEGYNAIRVPMLQALQQEFGIVAWLLASSQERVHMALTSQTVGDKAIRLYLAKAFRMRAAAVKGKKAAWL